MGSGHLLRLTPAVKLPPRKKPGDPILASDWNMLLDAIAARTPRPGSGLELTTTAGGFTYSSGASPGSSRSPAPPFSVAAIRKDAGSWKVTLHPGWVIERILATGMPAVKFHMPTAGGIALDTVPHPETSMNAGDYLWCRYTTDASGTVTGVPQILSGASVPAGQHNLPPDPEGSGTPGEYLVRILRLEDVPDGPTVRLYQQSDIIHCSTLWRGISTGSGARVFASHDADGYRFRSIAGRASSAQIAVAEDGGTIRVTGNGKSGSVSFTGTNAPTQPLLGWDDGLVTTAGQVTLSVREFTVCDSGSPVTVKFLVID
jgi:hypothetical protein